MPSGINKLSLLYNQDVEDTLQNVEISTRQELQELADEEEIDINWEFWDKLVQLTKEEIQDIFYEYQPPKKIQRHRGNNKPYQQVYMYNLDNQLVKTFQTPQEAGKYLHINPIQVNHYLRTQKPYYKLRVFFTYQPIQYE